MTTRLYLDTARMGLMTPSVQQITREYTKLLACEGCSLSFEEFLWNGSAAWSSQYRNRFPALAEWDNPDGLKRRLRRLAGLSNDLPTYLASRSSELFRIAARLVCRNGRRILTTETEWPGYMSILEQQSHVTDGKIIRVPTPCQQESNDLNVVRQFAEVWRSHKCDALFLSAINHLGRRLPVAEIIDALEPRPMFVIIDGAQHFGHVPAESLAEKCDVYIAGCHKWLGAGVPVGMALCCREATVAEFEAEVKRCVLDGTITDPLLRLLELHRLQDTEHCGETVNVCPLLNCRAAVADATDFVLCGSELLANRVSNARAILDQLGPSTWKLRTSFKTGILTLQGHDTESHQVDPKSIRCVFQERGIAVSTFVGGIVRLSMPTRFLTDTERNSVVRSLRRAA